MRSISYTYLAALFTLTLMTNEVIAQNYPDKPIRMIVPFSPGGGVDLIGRTIAQKMQETWGLSLIHI